MIKFNFRLTGKKPGTNKSFYAFRSIQAASYKDAVDQLRLEFPAGTKFISIDLIEESKNGK